MTKSEIISVVMGHAGVLKVDVVEAEPWMVTIQVTIERYYDDVFELRSNIMMSLEPCRPAGVGFEVVLKRDGDPFVPANALSRFHAVAAEITAHIAPLKKPSPPVVEKVVARQLFAEVIKVDLLGVPSPCPRCQCQAFTPDKNGKQIACRGCPLPSPVFEVETLPDGPGVASREYRCCSCGAKSQVTMAISQINLYCWGCKRLALHDLKTLPNPVKLFIDTETKKQTLAAIYGAKDQRVSSGAYINEVLGVPIPVEDPSRDPERASRVLKGSKAIFKFKDVEVGTVTDIKYVESEFDADTIDAMELYRDVPPGKGYSISMTVQAEDGKDWAQTIEQLQQRAVMSPAAQLMESYREKLGLMPFAAYEKQQREDNFDVGAPRSELDRRTGRTTRGLIRAIAEFVVSDLGFLAVVGHTERYTKELAYMTCRMRDQLDIVRQMEVRPIMPLNFDPRSDYTRLQRAYVYVDHSYEEYVGRFYRR